MGKLRVEPKVKVMDAEKYTSLSTILKDAQQAAADNHIFWDLEKGENAANTRKDFLYVAKKEGISLQIRRLRKKACLSLEFKNEPSSAGNGRISSTEYKDKVVDAIRQAGSPLKKSQILAETELSSSTWNLRIKELIDEGAVVRTGERREAVYSLP